MTISKKLGLIWRVIKTVPQLEALDVELSSTNGDQQKEAELAYRAGVIDQHQLNRLRSLWRFVKLVPQAREIELEWQRIQQNEHDFQFAFESHSNPESQAQYLYRKGIADGVKWCLNRFS